jgi:hypothetical protein
MKTTNEVTGATITCKQVRLIRANTTDGLLLAICDRAIGLGDNEMLVNALSHDELEILRSMWAEDCEEYLAKVWNVLAADVQRGARFGFLRVG